MKSETDRGGSIIATVIAAALLLLAIAGAAKLLPKDKTAPDRPGCVASNPCSADSPLADPN
jgi:hypothetical protein